MDDGVAEAIVIFNEACAVDRTVRTVMEAREILDLARLDAMILQAFASTVVLLAKEGLL